jgi:hypothetical protein
MNNRVSQSLLTALKVVGHLIVAALVTGLLIRFTNDPKLVVYLPVVNIVTATLIKFFSIQPSELPTIDTAPPSNE